MTKKSENRAIVASTTSGRLDIVKRPHISKRGKLYWRTTKVRSY